MAEPADSIKEGSMVAILIAMAMAQGVSSVATQQAFREWYACTDNYIKLVIDVPDPSDIIADAAFEYCDGREGAYRLKYLAMLKEIGWSDDRAKARSAEVVVEMKSSQRKSMIMLIQLQRAARR